MSPKDVVKYGYSILTRIVKTAELKIAKRYLRRQGLLELLAQGDNEEFAIDWYDLYHLYRDVRKLKPPVVLEFGVGFSTIAIAHALHQNYAEAAKFSGAKIDGYKLYTVDTSQHWLDNTMSKLPESLIPHVEAVSSSATACIWEGEFCHMYDQLPDVRPSMIYLDGPNPGDVRGEFHGLSFPKSSGPNRPVISADILLYESTYKPGTKIIVDGRYQNVQFLRRHLKRKYRYKTVRLWNYSEFVCTR